MPAELILDGGAYLLRISASKLRYQHYNSAYSNANSVRTHVSFLLCARSSLFDAPVRLDLDVCGTATSTCLEEAGRRLLQRNRCGRRRKQPSENISDAPGCSVQHAPRPDPVPLCGWSVRAGTRTKQSLNDRLCRIEFCQRRRMSDRR